MSFWVLPVTVNLNGLATGAMKVNCDHERTTAAWRLQIGVWQNMSFQSNHPE
ncbi:hypothetical protein [Shigella sonnei]|uniref:hypothetical protein n=1 Tax=Shigella sonnei TaxID=624 RepID=UPI001493B819|nr:hypothetical protein [Shigella sonnei]EFS5575534.1 hypothetical protein [Shigella sonnei]